ncbi:ERI1 exoribonuclease 2 [Protobothrops mucrosquamatus]|uniref:ERI1 exoribonuclease 2 n=1 Tax=Protobothrops mucrosquamatus TaxID=103944 RepID=UPI0007757A44|nr:ERI1 exoribonuclease 2 [Protobothrops mucrosquamatus]
MNICFYADWDLGICLHYECKRKQLRKPDILNSWIDLRATYKNFYSRRPQGLNGALKDVGILFQGREHSGLDDSRNTARLAWKMIRDGCVMKITKSIDKHPCYRPSGWGDKGHLISNLSRPNQGLVLVPTTLSTVNISETDISTTPECLSLLADWEDVAILPEKEDGPDPESLPSKDNPPPKRALATEDRNELMNWAAENMEGAPPNTELSKSIVYKSPNTTIYNAGRAPNKTSDASTFKLPVVTTEASSPSPPDRNHPASSTEAIKRKPSSPKSLPPTKKPSFRIYKDGNPTSSSFQLPRANPSGVSPALLSSSGNLNPAFRAAETGRMTPPLCRCGRRARRLNVSNGGPNQGKGFYSCPVRKCERNTKGCNYFRWEHSLIKEKMALPTLTLEAGGLKPLKTQDPSLGNVKCLRLRPSMRN